MNTDTDTQAPLIEPVLARINSNSMFHAPGFARILQSLYRDNPRLAFETVATGLGTLSVAGAWRLLTGRFTSEGDVLIVQNQPLSREEHDALTAEQPPPKKEAWEQDEEEEEE